MGLRHINNASTSHFSAASHEHVDHRPSIPNTTLKAQKALSDIDLVACLTELAPTPGIFALSRSTVVSP